MKSALFASIVSLLTLSGCATSAMGDMNQPSRAYHGSANLASAGVALEGYCPVAYFAVGKPVRGLADYATDHEGVTYHFVSADARDEFRARPTRYVPQYGGWCAFGMSVGDKFPVDPTRFSIVNDRLLVFLRNSQVDALKLWNDGNESENLQKAAEHWRKVRG
ncbi:MAG: YHS domain-containing (seleno)protein [Planctomycetota bacterium]